MEMFILKFAEQFNDTDTSTFSEFTRFREDTEEWDSLIGLSVIAMVDAEYGIVLKGEDIRQSNTIGDIFRIIEARK